MTKRTAEAAFDIMSQRMAVDAKEYKPLDSGSFQSFFIDASLDIEHVLAYVSRRSARHEALINRLAAYLDQDPRCFWYMDETGEVCCFLDGVRQDLAALAHKFVEWRCQGRVGNLCATLHGKFRKVPRNVVRGWLREKSAVTGQTYSDTLWQAHEIWFEHLMSNNPKCGKEHARCYVLQGLAGLSGLAAPPSIMETPTGITDDEGESDESESERESE